MKVFKFGGTSVKNAEAIKNVCNIISNESELLTVVFSAMGNSTNLLEELVKAYCKQNENMWDILAQIEEYHFEIIDELFNEEIPQAVIELFDNLKNKLKSYPSLDSNYEYDQIICYGELISTSIVSIYMNSISLNNKWIDIRKMLKTNDQFRNAKVDWNLSDKLIKKELDFTDVNLYVTQGFIGSTIKNLTTTIGRDGSDYTSAILGSILNAESVTIWKDVLGVLNGDPKKMKNAIKIDKLSYKEAVEMTHSGAKVIHPKTMKPLHNKGIPLYVKSFGIPDDPGTVIHKIDHKIELPPIFITKENQVLITLSKKDFSIITIEDIDRVVNFLMKKLIKVTLMQQSAIDLNIVADMNDEILENIFNELAEFYNIRYNTELTLVTIRHYNEEVLDRIAREKDIYLEQHSRLTARMLIKE